MLLNQRPHMLTQRIVDHQGHAAGLRRTGRRARWTGAGQESRILGEGQDRGSRFRSGQPFHRAGGGGGGCMVALTPGMELQEKVAIEIENRGYEVLRTKIGVEKI